jgi:hypothetical protein
VEKYIAINTREKLAWTSIKLESYVLMFSALHSSNKRNKNFCTAHIYIPRKLTALRIYIQMHEAVPAED